MYQIAQPNEGAKESTCYTIISPMPPGSPNRKMPKVTKMILAGMTFSTGLLLGLILHLPGAQSPAAPITALEKNPNSNYRLKRSILEDSVGVNGNISSSGISDMAMLTRKRENDLWDKPLTAESNKAPHSMQVDSDSVLRNGLSHSISADKQPSGSILQSNNQRAVGGNKKETFLEMDTRSVNIEARLAQESGSLSKQMQSQGIQHGVTQSTLSEIEIDLSNGDKKDGNLDLRPEAEKQESVDGKNAMLGFGVQQVVDGVHWTPEAELFVPPGFHKEAIEKWREMVASTKVVAMKEGCGRMQNRLLTFVDGTQACARYRLNTDQVQGEVYSYYLAQLLGITNVPPLVLEQLEHTSPKWSYVNLEIVSAQWHPSKVVILIPWVDSLTPAYIPKQFRSSARKLHPDNELLKNMSPDEVSELMQWSDLVIFDYLTANLDRVVNNMFNLQWNSGMMESPAHNLEKSTKSGHLVFLDNESGMFHSYRLLQKYNDYHEDLLKSLCVFRERTSNIIARLHESKNTGEQLQKLFESQEPLSSSIPRIPLKNIHMLQARIDNVYKQIHNCERMFAVKDEH